MRQSRICPDESMLAKKDQKGKGNDGQKIFGFASSHNAPK